ncbi:MAG: DUF1573 domain-containing protein [Ferruginibacter sp.]|nr:DUF1573 domain-containing protein [Ferruginibacter sp.]
MKKLFLIASLCVGSLAINAQVVAVDPHAGHNHGTETKKEVRAVDPHEGHNHGTETKNAVATIQPVANTVVTPEVNMLDVTETYDFGKIPQGKPVTHNFEVTNIGKTAYKLDNVAASCGCTTPEWNKEKVINPGEKTSINIGFNAAAEGPFTKPVTITYNGTQTKVITIKGEVWKTPAASAPANAGLNDLKN